MALSTLFTLFVVPCAYRILPGRVRGHPQEDALEPAAELRANGGSAGGP
jgi:hypothetical protein